MHPTPSQDTAALLRDALDLKRVAHCRVPVPGLAEVVPVVDGINHAVKHLRGWMLRTGISNARGNAHDAPGERPAAAVQRLDML